MVQENPAKQYIVRTSYVGLQPRVYRLWAFSAEDAKSQVNLELELGSQPIGGGGRGYITYVGPFNPECKCLNECRCGVLTVEQAKQRA